MKKFTIKDVQDFLREHDINNSCTLLSAQYENSKTPLLFKCNICGDTFERNFTNVKRNEFYGCSRCSRKRILSIEEIKQFLYDNDKNKECELLSTQYKNYHTPLKFKCNLCGEEFYRTTAQLKQFHFKCEKCARKIQKRESLSIIDVQKFIKTFDVENSCTLLSTDYKNNHTPLKFKCNLCGEEFERTFQTMKAKKAFKCSRCARGLPKERLTRIYEANIKYFRGKTYKWKKDFLESHNCCDITKKKEKDMHIHHLYSFSTILKQASENTGIPLKYMPEDYDKNGYSLDVLTKEFLRLHNETPAVLLSRKIHYLFHKKYGFKNNTPEQYYEFKDLFRKEDIS